MTIAVTPPARRAAGVSLRWAGLVTVPLVAAGLLLWAVSGTHEPGVAVAAIVNEDRPVTIQGQLVPLGRQLAGLLVDGTDEQFRWVLTSAADARRGLAAGDYQALVTVPPSFSEQATSAAASNDPAKAGQGLITVTSARDAALVDASVARQVVQAATTSLNAQVVQTYLENVYLGFNTLHTELGKAADGAATLAGGTHSANTGARQLSDGAAQLDSGSGRLATGARQLAAGTGQVAAGARQLSTGLADATKQTADLPAQAGQLASGARQVADGNRQLAQAVVPVANAAIGVMDTLSSLGPAVDQLAQLDGHCPRLLYRDFCSTLDRTAGTMRTQSSSLNQHRGGIRGQLVTLRDSVSALASGSEQVAQGTRQLANAAPTLVTGIAKASTGARQLADGSAKVDAGAQQLASGARQLNDGSGRLVDGAGQLSDGVSKIDNGMTTLSNGLSDARTKVPTFTAAQRTQLAKAVATPALVRTSGEATSRLTGSLFLVLALWLGAVAIFMFRRPSPPDLASSRTTWRLAVTAGVPAVAVAAVTGALLGGAMAGYLGLGPGRSIGLVIVAALVGAVFAVVNQALATVLRSAGSLAGVLVVLVTATVGITSTSPSTVASLARLLPTHDAGTAFRAVTMGGGGLLGALLALTAWAAAAVAVTAWAVERQRRVSPRLLRPALA